MEFKYCDLWKFYSCDLCPYRTTSLLRVTSHIKLHRTIPKPDLFTCDSSIAVIFYKCEICGFETALKVNLSNHIKVIHEKVQVKYDFMDIIRNFTCRSCDFQSHSFLLLVKHAWTCASKDELMTVMGSHRRTKKCRLCPFVTQDEVVMSRHCRFLHREAGKQQRRQRSDQEPKKDSKIVTVTQVNASRSTNDLKTAQKQKKYRPTQVKASRNNQEQRVYLIPLYKLENMYITHRDAFMNRYGTNEHPQIRAVHQNNILATDGACFTEHSGNQSSEILFIPIEQLNDVAAPQSGASKKRKKQPKVCPAPKQHPEVCPTAVPNISKELQQCASCRTDTFCVADISNSYQCKFCSFSTQFKVLISYHENLLHKSKKVDWDLVRIFQDFECSSCEFRTASRLVMMKHLHLDRCDVCDCYQVSPNK